MSATMICTLSVSVLLLFTTSVVESTQATVDTTGDLFTFLNQTYGWRAQRTAAHILERNYADGMHVGGLGLPFNFAAFAHLTHTLYVMAVAVAKANAVADADADAPVGIGHDVCATDVAWVWDALESMVKPTLDWENAAEFCKHAVLVYDAAGVEVPIGERGVIDDCIRVVLSGKDLHGAVVELQRLQLNAACACACVYPGVPSEGGPGEPLLRALEVHWLPRSPQFVRGVREQQETPAQALLQPQRLPGQQSVGVVGGGEQRGGGCAGYHHYAPGGGGDGGAAGGSGVGRVAAVDDGSSVKLMHLARALSQGNHGGDAQLLSLLATDPESKQLMISALIQAMTA